MNFKRYLNENRTALNWNNINRVRLQKNSRPGFSLGYGEALTCALARVDRLPLYDIYEPKSQKSRRIFKFLQFRTKRTVFSRKFDIFRHRAQIIPLRYIRIKITNITQAEQKGLSNFPNCDGQLNFSAPDCKKYFLQSEHISDVRKKFILSTLINLRIRQLVKKIN